MPARFPRLALLPLLALVWITQPGQACAVPTNVRVENGGALTLRTLQLSEMTSRHQLSEATSTAPNQLPMAGLAPGAVMTIILPSCVGVYAISATFSDGRVVNYPNVNATTIKGFLIK